MTTSQASRNVATLNRFIDVMDPKYGAVGDGTTDDLTPLTSFLNDLIADPSAIGLMPVKTFAISGALPQINVSGLKLIGCGPGDNHNTGSTQGTIIKAITNAGFTMLTIAPTEGASAQFLSGIEMRGITFDANSIAAKGVVIKSTRYSDIDISVKEATTYGLELNTCATLGDPTSLQFNVIRYQGRQQTNAAPSMYLGGDSSGNVSFNTIIADVVHKNEIGIVEANADNNMWIECRIFQVAGGSASNSIEWRGGATSGTSCRAERFLNLSATVAPIAKGTGTYTVGAQNIRCVLDDENSTPDVTVETGATAWDGRWIASTPTPTSGSGAFVTVSCLLTTKRDYKNPKFRAFVTITDAGTAGGQLNIPLPYTHKSGSVLAMFAGRQMTDGYACPGFVTANTATLSLTKYDGTTIIATGKTIGVSGEIETA